MILCTSNPIKAAFLKRKKNHLFPDFGLCNFHLRIPKTCRKQLLYSSLLYPHCPHNCTFCQLCKGFSTQGNSTNPGVMLFCSPADHRTSCSLFQRCQPAKKLLFLSASWCHWVLKAETCPQHVEGEASCPRVILIFASGGVVKGTYSHFSSKWVPHPSSWQLNLKGLTRRKLLNWWLFLWFMHWYKNVSLQKEEKKICGNFHNNFFLLLNKLGQDPNEDGWLCWVIKG